MQTVHISEIIALAPMLVVLTTAVLVLLLDVFAQPTTDRGYAAGITAVGATLAFALNWLVGDAGTGGKAIFFGALAIDGLTRFGIGVILLGTALSALLATPYFRAHGLHRGEFYSLLLLSALGAMAMVAATDFLTLFVALEVMSIAAYVLTGYQRHRDRSAEAALKYFIMGAFSSAFLLYGMAFLYGATGTTLLAKLHADIGSLARLGGGLTSDTQPFLMLGLALTLVGFLFKIAAVPFHSWAPDVYEGAPSPATAFMASVVKVASVFVFMRVFVVPLASMASGQGWGNPWGLALWGAALLTMIVGNLGALNQDNIKRMLAYSSVAHGGYLLVGLLAAAHPGGREWLAGLPFYLLVYTLVTMGTFGVVILLGREGEENLSVAGGWAGMGWKRPVLGVSMLVFMLTLAGMPPTAGFFGKFYLFAAAVGTGSSLMLGLVIVGVLMSVLSVYYYLRVTVFLFFAKPKSDDLGTVSPGADYLVAACAAAVLLLGMWPESWDWASGAVAGFFSADWMALYVP